MRHLTKLVGALGVALAVQACVVHDTPVNMGYGYAPARGMSVGQPSPYEVSSMPPEPLYEQMSVSPGEGFVWIDGYWHWNGYEWVWVSGRWEQQQDGYVYVQPYYDYSGDAYVYTPGYWSRPELAPRGWRLNDRHDGRPAIVSPPQGPGARPPGGGVRTPPGGYRPPTRPGGIQPPRPFQPEPPIYQGPAHQPRGVWQEPTAPTTEPIGSHEPVYQPPQPVRPPTMAPPTYQPPPPTYQPAAPIYSRPTGPTSAPPPAQRPTAPPPQHPTAPAPAPAPHPTQVHPDRSHR